MAAWTFPPLDEHFDYVGAMQALETEGIRPVRDQHIVSKVILKKFSASLGQRRWQLARYDKSKRRELDPKGPDACGKIPGFIQYASGSAEQLWHEVENRLDAAIKAAELGALHQSESHLNTVKDAIALHLVRSPRYRRIHERSVIEAIQGVRSEILQNNTVPLLREFRRVYGLEAAGPEALDLLLHRYLEKWRAYEDNGALLRVSIERAYKNVQFALQELTVEVLHAPLRSEFIVADAPAFTYLHRPDGSMALQMAIGDSNGIGLPLSSRCFVSIAPDAVDTEVAPDVVDRLNRVQVEIAEKQLYYRPGADVKSLIKAM